MVSRREEGRCKSRAQRSFKVGDAELELRSPKKSLHREAQSQWHLVLQGKTSKFPPHPHPGLSSGHTQVAHILSAAERKGQFRVCSPPSV